MPTTPTQIIPFTRTPSRAKPATFSADMDVRLAEENSRIAQMNAMNAELNGLSAGLDAQATAVAHSATQAAESATLAATNGAEQVNLAKDEVALAQNRATAAANSAALATINGAEQVDLAKDEVILAKAESLAASNSATVAITKAGEASASEIVATNKAGQASDSATQAQLRAWEAEAQKKTSDSFANEAEDVFCKIYTSSGDGTFTSANSTKYSSNHYAIKASNVVGDGVISDSNTSLLTTWSSEKISNFVSESAPSLMNKPTIISPANGTVGFLGEVISSAFSTASNFSGSHDFSKWRVSTTSDMSNIILESTVGNLTEFAPSGLTPVTEYFIDVQHGSDYHLSDFSDVISFTTANTYIVSPTVTATGLDTSKPTISLSAFDVVGGTDTHISTDYQVVRVSDSVVVFESLANTSSKLGITIDVDLDSATQYAFKARFNGQDFGSSAHGLTTHTMPTIALPAISITTSVNENTATTGTIANYDASALYTFSNNVTYTNGDTFTYNAPDITDALNTTDTFSVYAVKNGFISDVVTTTMTIIYVPMVADDAISIADFQTNEEFNDEWEY